MKILAPLAPSDAAASSVSRSISSSTGCTAHHERQCDERQRYPNTGRGVLKMKLPPGCCSYSANITRLATMVATQTGRSIIASTIRFCYEVAAAPAPRRSASRTLRLMTVTAVEIVSVNERLPSRHATRPPARRPASNHRPRSQTMAASGNSTITESHHRHTDLNGRVRGAEGARGTRRGGVRRPTIPSSGPQINLVMLPVACRTAEIHAAPAEVGDRPQFRRVPETGLVKSAATAGSTGRKPACAHNFCACTVLKFLNAVAASKVWKPSGARKTKAAHKP